MPKKLKKDFAVQISFEPSRIKDALLADAYERLAPSAYKVMNTKNSRDQQIFFDKQLNYKENR